MIYIKNKIIVLSIFFLLYLFSFYDNTFGVVTNEKWNSTSRYYSEAFVIGRLINAENLGVFNCDVFTCKYEFLQYTTGQYECYFDEKIPAKNKRFYFSQIGGQAILYSIIDYISPYSNYINYEFFQFINSFFLALLIICFLNWSYNIFGAISTIFTGIMIFFSSWIVYIANDIWWCLWVYYLPFIFFLYYFKNHEIVNNKKIFLYSFLLISLKTFLNGFEFISTALICMTVGMFFYYYYRKKSITEYLYTLLSFISGSFLAILFNILYLIYFLKIHFGSYKESINLIFGKFIYRTLDSESNINNTLIEKIYSYFLVIKKYLAGNAFEFNFAPFTTEYKTRFLYLILLIIISFLYLIKFKSNLKNKSLIFTTIFSTFAPLSWFIIFKEHSSLHGHINFFLWYVPFLFVGFLTIGVSISNIFKYEK